MKDEFLATISHELRNPLNAIMGWAHMLRLGKLTDVNAERAVETIYRNAKSQAQLVSDLLDVSRIISGKLRLDVRTVDLIFIINAAIDSIRPAAEAKGIRLQTMLDPAAGPIRKLPEIDGIRPLHDADGDQCQCPTGDESVLRSLGKLREVPDSGRSPK